MTKHSRAERGSFMFKKVEIKNFKGMKDFSVDNLKQINLIIGENNSGKSTFLEALFLLMGFTNPEMFVRINKFRGYLKANDIFLKSYFYGLEPQIPVQIIAGLTNPEEERKIQLQINLSDTSEVLAEEEISPLTNTIEDEKIKAENIGSLKMIYTVSKHPNEEKLYETYLDILKTKDGWKYDREKASEYKEPIFGRFIFDVSTILKEIPQITNTIITNKKENKLLKYIKKIEPSIKDIYVIDGTIFVDVGFPSRIPLNLMGGGTKIIFSYLAAIIEGKSDVILIDEFESGLHRKAQQKSWEAIVDLIKDTNLQLFATTHSLDCIKTFFEVVQKKRFKDKFRLFRFDKDKEKIIPVEYDYEILKTTLNKGWDMR